MDTNTKMDAQHANKSAQIFPAQSARARIRQLAAPALLTLVGGRFQRGYCARLTINSFSLSARLF